MATNISFRETFFGAYKNTPVIYYRSESSCGRANLNIKLIVHSNGFTLINEVNNDGSIDVLGYGDYIFEGKVVRENRKDLQTSLKMLAKRLTENGATITRQTKNILEAKYRNERVLYAIK